MFKLLFLIPVLIVAAIVSITIYLQPNDFVGCTPKPSTQTSCGRADAIVVVSGGDTAARTAAGINLYKDGWADYLVVSGAALDKTGPSNAAAMKQQAEQAGVPSRAILIDEASTNTQENAENTQSIFKANNFQNVILVTSGYHQRRASLEFNKIAQDMSIRNYPVLSDKDWGWYWWMTPRGWWLASGEVIKIIAFHVGASA